MPGEARRGGPACEGQPESPRGYCQSPSEILPPQHIHTLCTVTTSPKARSVTLSLHAGKLRRKEGHMTCTRPESRGGLAPKVQAKSLQGPGGLDGLKQSLLGPVGRGGQAGVGSVNACCLPAPSLLTEVRTREPLTRHVDSESSPALRSQGPGPRGVLTTSQGGGSQQAAEKDQHHLHGVWGRGRKSHSLPRRLPAPAVLLTGGSVAFPALSTPPR